MGSKTKIDWCDATWNPVTGCLHGCEYCYARRIAERFGGATPSEYGTVQKLDALNRTTYGKPDPYPYGFLPTFHCYKLDEPRHWKKPKNIFVCSMADLFGDWVPNAWIEEVFRACEKAPWHRYLFLTKNPKRYESILVEGKLPGQHWYGTSVTHKNDKEFFRTGYNTFVSIEPMLESFSNENHVAYRQMVQSWVILGAETGIRRGKVIPEKEWITELVDYYSRYGYTKFFMKESLRGLMGAEFRQEFPWEGDA